MKHYDVLVIGAGPGGYVAAEEAARLGKSVAVIERQAIGGTCLNVGCIPSKAYLEHAHWIDSISKTQQNGMQVELSGVDFTQLYERKNKVIASLQKGIHSTFKSLNIDFIEGEAIYTSNNTFEVNGEKITYEDVLLATGSQPFIPPIPGLSSQPYLTTDTFFSMEVLPEKLVIIGGGVIAVELAFAMEALGVEVTMLEVAKDILLTEDEDARKIIKQKLKNRMTVETEVVIKNVTNNTVELEGDKQYTYDRLLIATGRKPNIDLAQAMNLEFDEQGKFIAVDEYYQTSKPHVYAVGDVIGGYTLAHSASTEGIKAVRAMNKMKERPLLNCHVPRSLFTHPEVATFGLSEEEAKVQGYDVVISQLPFGFNGRAIAVDQTEGFIKLIVERKYGEILGAIICGPEATEILHQVLTLVEAEGTIYELASTVYSHPTVSELVQDVAKAIVREI